VGAKSSPLSVVCTNADQSWSRIIESN